VKEEKDQKLLSQKGGGGFPYLVFMDADGNVTAKHAGQRTVEAFGQTAEKAKAFADLKKKADGGDKTAGHDYFLQALDLSHFTAEAARKKMAEVDLSAEEKEKVETKCVDLEVTDALSTITEDKETRVAAGKKFAEMKKAGRVAKSDQTVQPFWIIMMEYAEAQKDAALYEEGLNALKEKFSAQMGNPKVKEWFAVREETLAKLKAGNEKK
jgi:hypothetical protein